VADETRWESRAELDVSGETGRQTQVFVAWALCLAFAIIMGITERARVPLVDRGTPREDVEVARSQRARLWIALFVGFLAPTCLSIIITRRRMRGGAHPRGIVIDVTHDGELRLWGRGYGQRVDLEAATITERLVDVYAGRLGAWRQRRLTITPRRGRPLELATVATAEDDDLDLVVFGGEGNCVELPREDYLALFELSHDLAGRDDAPDPQV
jgi:hypothetical protein